MAVLSIRLNPKIQKVMIKMFFFQWFPPPPALLFLLFNALWCAEMERLLVRFSGWCRPSLGSLTSRFRGNCPLFVAFCVSSMSFFLRPEFFPVSRGGVGWLWETRGARAASPSPVDIVHLCRRDCAHCRNRLPPVWRWNEAWRSADVGKSTATRPRRKRRNNNRRTDGTTPEHGRRMDKKTPQKNGAKEKKREKRREGGDDGARREKKTGHGSSGGPLNESIKFHFASRHQ